MSKLPPLPGSFTLAVCDEALGALGEMFAAIPKDTRDKHEGNRQDVERLIEKLKAFIQDYESKPARSRTSQEKAALHTVKEILSAILALETDDDRRDLCEQILERVCPACGAKGSQQEHDCPLASPDDEDDEDGEDEEDEEDGEDEEDEEPEEGT
jgi:hypothetical protein